MPPSKRRPHSWARPPTEAPAGKSIEALAQEKLIVRLVNTLLADAVLRRASDIHIRPLEKSGNAHFRIDGVLMRIGELHRSLLPGVVARIKVLAGMDLAEHRLPQDGAIRFRAPSGLVDMRVSIMPTVHGENVVIRILDPRMGLRRLEDIGFSETDGKRFRQLINRNQGLVLVTGPTGCGKTTTLYAALQTLNTGEFHIMTVEDPVEYRIDGLAQVQVNPVIQLDFATVLRNILRHDPDIILVGEVRDAQTAKIAVESALTGHLVFSTLHTNGAAQTVTRLIEIGVAPYLVNATLAGVLAQRLVRRNCEHCRIAEEADPEIRESLGVGRDEQYGDTTPRHLLSGSLHWTRGDWEADLYLNYKSDFGGLRVDETFVFDPTDPTALPEVFTPLDSFASLDMHVGYRISERVRFDLQAINLIESPQAQTSGPQVQRRMVGSLTVTF